MVKHATFVGTYGGLVVEIQPLKLLKFKVLLPFQRQLVGFPSQFPSWTPAKAIVSRGSQRSIDQLLIRGNSGKPGAVQSFLFCALLLTHLVNMLLPSPSITFHLWE